MFQLSLSTSLTSPTTPVAGLTPAPSGAFSAALAGVTEAIEAPTAPGPTAIPTRQTAAETGKPLPMAAIADADAMLAWLDVGGAGTPLAAPTDRGAPKATPTPVSPDADLAITVQAGGQPIVIAALPTDAALSGAVDQPLTIARTPASEPTTVIASPPAAPRSTASGAESTSAQAAVDPSLPPVSTENSAAASLRPHRRASHATEKQAGTTTEKHRRDPTAQMPDAVVAIVSPLPTTRPLDSIRVPDTKVSIPSQAPSAMIERAVASPAPPSSISVVPLPSATAAVEVAPIETAPLPGAPQVSDLPDRKVGAPRTTNVSAPLPSPAQTEAAQNIAPAIREASGGNSPLPQSVPAPAAGTLFDRAVAAEKTIPSASPPKSSPGPASPTRAVQAEGATARLDPIAASPAPDVAQRALATASSRVLSVAPDLEHSLPDIGPVAAAARIAAPMAQVPTPPSSAAAAVIEAVRPNRPLPDRVAATPVAPTSAPVTLSPAIARPPTNAPSPSGDQAISEPVASVLTAALPAAVPGVATAVSVGTDPIADIPAPIDATADARQSRAIDASATPVALTAAARPAAATAPMPPPAQPAGMMFGIPLGNPTLDRRPADRSSPREEALQALTSLAASGSAAPIAAAAGAQHDALDMRRDDWPQAMIDRIEALRDAANATSTRITLAPDALGKVDLSIRHDGNAVHVHFAAEAAQTRAILADAQPRLAELAQARGLRLGQATVDAGAGGQGQRQQPAATPAPQPQRPLSAFTATTAEEAAADPTRLA